VKILSSWAAARIVARIMAGVAALGSMGVASAIHSPQAVSARTLLLRATANSQAQAYSGTLVTTSAVDALAQYERTFPAPVGASVEGATEQRIFHFAVRDRRHFRIAVSWKQPAIDGGTVTFVENGGPLLEYDDRGNVFSTTSARGLSVFDLTGASPLATRSFGRFGSVQAAVNGIAKATFGTVQLVGQDTVAGRLADVVTVQDPNTAPIRVWIDHTHPYILRWQQGDAAQVLTAGSFSAQVTSIAYGVAPAASLFRFTPPTGAVNVHREVCIFSCSSSVSGANRRFDSDLHPGYFRVPAPNALPAAVRRERLVYMDQEPFMLRTSPPIITYGHTVTNWSSGSREVMVFVGPYLYIQERIHVHGLPSSLKQGTRHGAEPCVFWAQSLPGGRHGLAVQVARVSVAVHTTALTARQLATYARHDICTVR
jgi:hypothetical protein